ncbi:unnamed protein product [Brassica rapa]|uniref:Protein transport protein SEC23 n=1 Tax=Brassica campestris TaxID=3711 RepID=A0A8D9M500_BRACM|nr:unnamed protein product [Brassica rapa]
MCRQNCCAKSSQEEEVISPPDENLLIYCKHVRLYNILRIRSLYNVNQLRMILLFILFSGEVVTDGEKSKAGKKRAKAPWAKPLSQYSQQMMLNHQKLTQPKITSRSLKSSSKLRLLVKSKERIKFRLKNVLYKASLKTPPHVFVFVLDTCMIEEELGFAKSALKQTIGLLPENALVGFVSFGTQAHVHELGFSEMSKVFVFKGNKEVSKNQVLDQLRLSSRRVPTSGFPKRAQNGFQSAAGVNRFLLHASDCEYTLDLLLDELQTDNGLFSPVIIPKDALVWC